MKIVFVSSYNDSIGISPIVKNQVESLCKIGLDVDYYPVKGGGIFGYIKNIRPLRKFLMKKSYDIIHAHYGLSGIISALAKRKNKLIVSYMGDDLIGSNKIDGSYYFSGKIITSIVKIFARFFNHYSIVKSEEMSMKLKNLKNVATIPNGVDLDKFYIIPKDVARAKLNLPKNKKLVLFAADPKRPEKNYPLAKKATELLNDDVELITVFSRPQNELLFYYNAVDCLVLSSFHEGSPNVIKEAMACNCPIVSTNVGDVKKIIDNTEGCFIASFQPEEYSNKINMAISFANKTNGRAKIQKLGYDSETIARSIQTIYNKI